MGLKESDMMTRLTLYFTWALKFEGLQFRSSEKAMAPRSNTLAWKIPWTEGPGGLQSMGSLGVGHG